MSKQANPTLIGTFVIAALALLAGGVAIFGGSELLQRKERFVTYFDGSVKGLRVGSNVVFRGVRVGYVTNISLVARIEDLSFTIPVTYELRPDSFTVMQGSRVVEESERGDVNLDELIGAGLRAQLGVENFVTGQLHIELDLKPDQPAVFRGREPAYPEIPSIPSDIQQVVEKVQRFVADIQEKVDFEKLGQDLQSTIDGLNRLVNSEDLRESLAGLNRFVNAEDTQRLTASLNTTLSDARTALTDLRALMGTADTQLSTLGDELRPAIERLDSTLAAGQQVLENASDQLGSDSLTTYELIDTLKEVQGAARSLRQLTDYLERHPEALLRGKPAD